METNASEPLMTCRNNFRSSAVEMGFWAFGGVKVLVTALAVLREAGFA